MKRAFLFAGQGSQKVGMGKELYESSKTFAEKIDQAEEIFANLAKADSSYEHTSLRQLMFEGPEEALSQTRYTQPALAAFAAGIIALLEEKGIQADGAAGLSLGEYSALYYAGVFDLKELIQLLTFRGRVMEEASSGIVCSMSAVLGLSQEKVREAVAEGSKSGIVEISNYNATGQIVIAGEEKAVAKAEEAAKELGAKRCMRLKVSGPFHTSFMKPAGDALAEKFKEVSFGEAKLPVIFNTTARPLRQGERIPELLVKQVQRNVQMEDTILYLAEHGFDEVIEIGPGKTLSGFVKRTAKGIKSYAVEDCKSMEKLLEAIFQEA